MPNNPALPRIALQQRILPRYRALFFDALAAEFPAGLSVFAGQPLAVESVSTSTDLIIARFVEAHNLHFFDPSSPLYVCWQRGFIEWLETWDPGVLIVEGNPRYFSSRPAIRWMRSRKRPVIGWGLGAPRTSSRLAKLRAIERHSFLGLLDGVIAYSRKGAAEYRAELDSIGNTHIPVFTATNAVVPPPTKPFSMRSIDNQSSPVVLFVGRLQTRKRLDLLFQACARLPVSLQPRLLVVGDGPARSAFEAQAARDYPQTEFMGQLHGLDLEACFAQADIFVLPGTGGLTIQQAMSFGLPVIVAQGDGTQDDLVRPGNGWQVAPDDIGALLRSLETALADLPRLRTMGRESYRIVQEEINLSTMVGTFVEAVQIVLK